MLFSKDNIKQVTTAFRKKERDMLDAASRGLIKGMRIFEGRVIDKQFSGRTSQERGKGKYLNRRSGFAAGSWYVDHFTNGGNTVVALKNLPSAFYIAVHQHHNFDGWIYPRRAKRLHWQEGGKDYYAKRVYLPKRLSIPEQFEKEGPRILSKFVFQAMLSEARRKM